MKTTIKFTRPKRSENTVNAAQPGDAGALSCSRSKMGFHSAWLAAALMATASLGMADDYKPEALKSGRADPSLHLRQGSSQTEAQKISEVIYKATGFGNTFMVVTDQGNVIVDTCQDCSTCATRPSSDSSWVPRKYPLPPRTISAPIFCPTPCSTRSTPSLSGASNSRCYTRRQKPTTP